MAKKKQFSVKTLGLVIGGAALALFTAAGVWWMLSLRTPDRLAAFEDLVASLGIGGWLLLLAIQYVQIVVAFIPGGPIQLVSGALYGPWGGMLLCLIGTALATVTIFPLVRRFGQRIIRLFVDDTESDRYAFLRDAKKLELLVLALYFIPGTPKDALTYLFALTPIPAGRFLLLSIMARVPGMLTSVLAGNSVMNGDYLSAGLFFVAITLLSIGGLLLHRKISDAYKARKKK